jgi:uncharacterized protein (TIGR03790 family)
MSFCIAKFEGGHEFLARRARSVLRTLVAGAGIAANLAGAPAFAADGFASAPAHASAPPPPMMRVPRVHGRILAKDIGLVINTDDDYSTAVGAYYIRQRHLGPSQVLRVKLPAKPVLEPGEFAALQRAIEAKFGDGVQALALAWVTPYAVQCNSITGALALGFDAGLCQKTCNPSRLSPYFNAVTTRPYADLHLRPSMLLAARSVDEAKALIDRGVAADHSLGLRGAPPAMAYFATTDDAARNVRAVLFPPAMDLPRLGVDLRVEHGPLRGAQRVLIYETGLAEVPALDTIGWLPGALADHLTSFGGHLDRAWGQMSALAWIDAGATASYGTVSEPCNHLQKFPHPQVLLLQYVQGASAIEAYWKSVAWPQQGVFIGEPLAAPFARR